MTPWRVAFRIHGLVPPAFLISFPQTFPVFNLRSPPLTGSPPSFSPLFLPRARNDDTEYFFLLPWGVILRGTAEEKKTDRVYSSLSRSLLMDVKRMRHRFLYLAGIRARARWPKEKGGKYGEGEGGKKLEKLQRALRKNEDYLDGAKSNASKVRCSGKNEDVRALTGDAFFGAYESATSSDRAETGRECKIMRLWKSSGLLFFNDRFFASELNEVM